MDQFRRPAGLPRVPASFRRRARAALRLATAGAVALASAPLSAQSLDLSLDYAGNALANPAGGERQRASYSHNLVVGAELKPSSESPWRLEAAVAWTAGTSLSERAIGDISGVQGTFNGGDALWLYKAALTRSDDSATISLGRISAGDWFAAPDGFANFVNAAFSSNGGAISINDPGRATSPASSWGMVGEAKAGAVVLRVGGFLSNSERTAIGRHGTDLAFRPSEGVIGLAEALYRPTEAIGLGIGGYYDTARFDRFDGSRKRGNGGGYAWIEYQAPRGPLLTAMIQAAPAEDRNLLPFFFLAAASWTGPFAGRPDDVASIGIHGGRISREAGLGDSEGAIEANYQYRLSKSLSIQPDLQIILRPRGQLPTALVLGLQVQVAL